MRLVLDPDIPNNGRLLPGDRVRADEGTVVNPVLPAACGARGITGFRVMDAVLGALAQAAPERVPADGEGGNSRSPSAGAVPIGGHSSTSTCSPGRAAGRRAATAPKACRIPGSNNANMPIEVAEPAYPVRFERYAIVPDSGGPGRFRGANAQVREFRYLGPRTTLQIRSDKRHFLPYGLAGGSAGSPSSTIVDPGQAGERLLPTIGPSELRPGETVRHVLASGGGWGDPLDRDPAAVSADVLAEKLSRPRPIATTVSCVGPMAALFRRPRRASAHRDGRRRSTPDEPALPAALNQRVPMRDGVELSADVWLPPNPPPGRSPRSCSATSTTTPTGATSPGWSRSSTRATRSSTQDCRGRFDSDGTWDP